MIDPTVMFKHHYGLYVISASTDEGYAACLINTATQVTAEPIQLVVSVNKQNVTCGRIMQAGHFALAIVDETADMPFIGRFGFRSSLDVDKFAGIPTEHDEFGDPYTTLHTCGMVSCAVSQQIDVGTHMLFVAEVAETKDLSGEPPMSYAYYHKVLKGKTPPKAASYVAGA